MLDQERIPFDLDGKDISAGMNYVPSQKAYDGHLDFTPLTIAYRNAPPMQAELHVGFLLRSGETEIKSLRLAAGNSKIDASGTLRNYNTRNSRCNIRLHWTSPRLEILQSGSNCVPGGLN